jgi:hypothetical protein
MNSIRDLNEIAGLIAVLLAGFGGICGFLGIVYARVKNSIQRDEFEKFKIQRETKSEKLEDEQKKIWEVTDRNHVVNADRWEGTNKRMDLMIGNIQQRVDQIWEALKGKV